MVENVDAREKPAASDRTLASRPAPVHTGIAPGERPVKIDVSNLSFYYGAKRALEGISIQLRANLVTALIGPSGCGKSTFLRTLNRMNDVIPGVRVDGNVRIGDRDIYGEGVDVVDLRRRIGMVFQHRRHLHQSAREADRGLCDRSIRVDTSIGQAHPTFRRRA